MFGHSCTLLGLSVGSANRAYAPPPHTHMHMFFSRRMTWRRTGGEYYPRSPHHKQPSRKCTRTPARPVRAHPWPPGPPLCTPGTRALTRPPRRLAGARDGWGGVWPPDDTRPRPSCRPSEHRGRSGGGTASRELQGGGPGATDVPVAGGRLSGATCDMVVDGRCIVVRR